MAGSSASWDRTQCRYVVTADDTRSLFRETQQWRGVVVMKDWTSWQWTLKAWSFAHKSNWLGASCRGASWTQNPELPLGFIKQLQAWLSPTEGVLMAAGQTSLVLASKCKLAEIIHTLLESYCWLTGVNRRASRLCLHKWSNSGSRDKTEVESFFFSLSCLFYVVVTEGVFSPSLFDFVLIWLWTWFLAFLWLCFSSVFLLIACFLLSLQSSAPLSQLAWPLFVFQPYL